MMAGSTPFGLLGLIVYAFLDALALTVLVFFRRRFGARFLTPVHLFLGWLLLQFAFRNDATGAGEVYIAAFLVLGVARQIGVYLRLFGRRGPAVLSRSAGEPFAFIRRVFRNQWLIVILIEPIAVVLLGTGLNSYSSGVSLAYFEIAAGLLFFQGLHLWRLAREERLDRQDLELMARRTVDAREEQRAPAEPAYVVGANRESARHLAGLRSWSEVKRDAEEERRVRESRSLPEHASAAHRSPLLAEGTPLGDGPAAAE
jgi:hypothetical protein